MKLFFCVSQKSNNIQNLTSKEEESYLENFSVRLDEIEKHNERFKRGSVPYDVGINEFSILGVDEFNARINGFVVTLLGEKILTENLLNNVTIPMSLNYTALGLVTSVRNQVQKPLELKVAFTNFSVIRVCVGLAGVSG